MQAGRFISYADLITQLDEMSDEFSVMQLGKSEENRTVFGLKIGTGETRIMAWSQMHGDEPTSTRVLLEFMRLLPEHKVLLSKYSFLFIPMLNPDGAEHCTRVSSKEIDLNRDFLNEKACETKMLKHWISHFQPDLCFNMHDQRSLFAVNELDATISVLAPSPDEERNFPPQRIRSAAFISELYTHLLNPPKEWGIGRFDDTFYPSAFGDNLMREGYANVLFEFGHTPGDYNRDFTPDYFSRAWINALKNWNPESNNTKNYSEIPLQEKRFVDLQVSNREGCEIYGGQYFLIAGQRVEGQFQWCFRPIDPDFHPIPRFEHTAASPLLSTDRHQELSVLTFEDGSQIHPEDFI
jgi:hypothetical protein